ncbi:hypothetical protein CLI64_20190 [Nostoc sp. CENA543]|uniref:hypothetical protein n=1 Tax=Nostoc sp. CENA543 TaxID=1869241 RepID=UPI000CA38FC3|nr:hypothetical protein [Nostoc sp. CENA543]AUT02522.1 hypothetical protein CLI64_20190 [Nostoc sp. CENA543]
MSENNSNYIAIFLNWLQITLSAFFLSMAIILILLPIFTILQLPSFKIGSNDIWLLHWQNNQEFGFNIVFNPVMLLAIASIIGLITIIFRHQKRL